MVEYWLAIETADAGQDVSVSFGLITYAKRYNTLLIYSMFVTRAV